MEVKLTSLIAFERDCDLRKMRHEGFYWSWGCQGTEIITVYLLTVAKKKESETKKMHIPSFQI